LSRPQWKMESFDDPASWLAVVKYHPSRQLHRQKRRHTGMKEHSFDKMTVLKS
jgi:hypothetical protein